MKVAKKRYRPKIPLFWKILKDEKQEKPKEWQLPSRISYGWKVVSWGTRQCLFYNSR
jgi:hypothetical protein